MALDALLGADVTAFLLARAPPACRVVAVAFVDARVAACAAALGKLDALAAELGGGLRIVVVPTLAAELPALMAGRGPHAVGLADAALLPRLAVHAGLTRGAVLVPEVVLLDAATAEPTLTDAYALLAAGRLQAAAFDGGRGWPRNCLAARCGGAGRGFARHGPSYPAAALRSELALRAGLFPGDPILVRTVGASRAAATAAGAVPSAAVYVNPPSEEEEEEQEGEEGDGGGVAATEGRAEAEAQPFEVLLPPAVFRDLGLGGPGPATVALQLDSEMPVAERVTLALLIEPAAAADSGVEADAGAVALGALAAPAAAAAPAPASSPRPSDAECIVLLREFFGLAQDESALVVERVRAAAGGADVRVSDVEASFLAARFRATRCLHFPLATGASIALPRSGGGGGLERRFVVVETRPAFSAVIVGPDTAVALAEPRAARRSA